MGCDRVGKGLGVGRGNPRKTECKCNAMRIECYMLRSPGSTGVIGMREKTIRLFINYAIHVFIAIHAEIMKLTYEKYPCNKCTEVLLLQYSDLI